MKIYDQLIPQRDAVSGSWNNLISNRKKDWGLYGHDTGLHPLNLAIGGLIPTRITTIGARSGTGKTASITSLVEAAGRVLNGRRAELCIFTWELDPKLLIDRSICSKVGITLRELNQGAKLLTEKFMGKLSQAYSEMSKLPVVYQMHSTDIDVVRQIAREFAKRCTEKSKVEGIEVLPVIVIDYLNMAQFEGSGLRTYGIGDFMNGLKQLCNELQAAGVVFSQISRSTDKENRVPDRADFSDSSAIENASDNLVVMYRPEYHKIGTVIDPETGLEVDSSNRMLIRVLKGRDYGIGDFLINCDIKYFRFYDSNHDWGYQYWELYKKKEFWLEHFGFTNVTDTLSEVLDVTLTN